MKLKNTTRFVVTGCPVHQSPIKGTPLAQPWVRQAASKRVMLRMRDLMVRWGYRVSVKTV